ncbi:propionyl-CoA synthetase [Chloroflexota bacterium]
MTGEYEETYQRSIDSPEEFWGEAARDIYWHKKWSRVIDDSNPPFYRWFPDAELNTCYNTLDYHVINGRAEQPALIYDSPVTDTIKSFTYAQLRDEVAKFAGVLLDNGVSKEDRVIIYMPMIPEAIIAMLACARIGAIHSVVFGGFAAKELAIRIDATTPIIIISASCGIETSKIIYYKPLLDKALELANHQPDKCIIYQREQVKADIKEGRDLDWAELMKTAKPADCVPVKATDPLYILHTSGTTGMPKGIVRDNGGHTVALKWSMKYIYGVEPGEVWWASSDIGWVVGHSYIVYAPLFHGCTTILYEGKPVGTPDPGAFWRVISQHKVKALFSAPTALRAIKREDSKGEYLKNYDLSNLKYLFLAGERTDPNTYYWIKDLLKVPIIDHWWQTETGWAITGLCTGVESAATKAGSCGKAIPGYQVQILDTNNNTLPPENEGTIAIKLPLPPGTLTTLWQNDQRYRESYLDPFPGYYLTADGGYIDRDGYVYVMGRIDDVINVAGHRLSTGAMEEIIANHLDVAECAVVGINDDLRGQVPIGFVVLKVGVQRRHAAIAEELVLLVKEMLGAIAYFRQVIIVDRLPKTRSGKILRDIMRKIANGEQYSIPPTIDDPAILVEIKDYLNMAGYHTGSHSQPST